MRKDHQAVTRENLRDPTPFPLHTLGRYLEGYGLKDHTSVSGVRIDEPNDLDRLKNGGYVSRTLRVKDPIIYGGDGFSIFTSTCSTYACNVWAKTTGESQFFGLDPHGWPGIGPWVPDFPIFPALFLLKDGIIPLNPLNPAALSNDIWSLFGESVN